MSGNLGARFGTGRLALAGGAAVLGLSLTGVGVFAGTNAIANNSSPEGVSSGTLKLTMSASTGSAGFSTAVSNMAPGDVINRYVTLSNGGSLDGTSLTLAAADATPSKLSTDATNGLHVTVTECLGGSWTVATGTCTGVGATPTTLLSNVAVSTLATAQTLVAGAVPAGTTLPLQVSLTLPDQSETTINGTLPANTIQGLSASLTWTFSEAQRAGSTTNS